MGQADGVEIVGDVRHGAGLVERLQSMRPELLVVDFDVDREESPARALDLIRAGADAALMPLAQPGAELNGLEQLSGGLVSFGGGIPLTEGKVVIGAIGVSAGSVEQDISVAEAGVAALGS